MLSNFLRALQRAILMQFSQSNLPVSGTADDLTIVRVRHKLRLNKSERNVSDSSVPIDWRKEDKPEKHCCDVRFRRQQRLDWLPSPRG